jgi:transcriptional regulator with XRE-family HTH domain
MMIKILRSQNKLSQEELAESSGLSLRTIQRVEAGHRVSYRSLRALASTFNVEVDELEWELYAMNKISYEFIESPLWVRLLLRKTWYTTNRRWSLIWEKASFCIFAIFFALAILPLFDGFQLESSPYLMLDHQLLIASLAFLMSAYWFAFIVRLSDKYSAWSQWETSGNGT